MSRHIPEHIIEEIRARADIVEIVSESLLMKKSGRNFLGLCPFHTEKTPSFTVSPEKQIYHCFGCGAGGNIFKFLMSNQNLSFVETVKKLGDRYGVVIPETSRQDAAGREVKSERETLHQLNQRAAEYFASRFQDPQAGKRARDYIKSRDLNPESVARFQIGWAPEEWRGLETYFQKKHPCPPALLEKAGLIKSRDEGKTGHYDRFRARLIFPFRDINGNLIGFAGRVLADKDQPKYLNSPETLLYKKSRYLYGLYEARQAIRQEDRVFLVEGYFDQIRAYQCGIKNVVATCGTALTQQQATLLKNHTRNVYLVFDSDRAGEMAAQRGYEVLLDQGMNVRVIDLPPGHDPDSFLLEQGADAFLKQADEATPFVEYFIGKAVQAGDVTSGPGRVEVVNRVMPILSRIKNHVERSEHLKYLSEKVGVEDQPLLAEVKKALAQQRPGVREQAAAYQAPNNSDGYLVHLMLLGTQTAKYIRERLELEDFQDPVFRRIAGLVYQQLDAAQDISVDRLLDRVEDPEARSLLTRIGVEPLVFDNPEKAADDCIERLQKVKLSHRIKDLKKQMLEAEKAGDSTRTRELNSRVREIQTLLSVG